MKKLFIIPARGGSKGIPGKNIKPLNGKPLIHYSIEYARLFAEDDDICLTTDSKEIAHCAKVIGYDIPFFRPAHLATDNAGTHEVILHALDVYENKLGKKYDCIILLQPTSPFRLRKHFTEAWELYSPSLDMVVSVKESEANPYFNLFEENVNGLLIKSKGGSFATRQNCPRIFQFNGSIYIINCTSVKQGNLSGFTKVVKYVMDPEYSFDLDTPFDWLLAECISKQIDYEG